MSFQLNKAYNRESFVEFLSDKFLPEDFRPKRNVEEIELSGRQNFATRAFRLGECRSLELEVFEIHHSSLNDARVGIAKDAFQLLLHHSFCNRALVAFVPDGSKQWRFSLLQADITLDNNKVRRAYSNPRRFSFLLGEDTAIKTPTQFLIEKERICQRTENGKTLSPWEDLVNRFSVEVLTKEFYEKLFNWYLWAKDSKTGVTFPNNPQTVDDDRDKMEIKMIRLITRMLFVWFIKQKHLVPNYLFDTDYLKTILRDFDPLSSKQGNYYNAILQNLFFATLNQEQDKRAFIQPSFQGKGESYGVKTLYRDNQRQSWFTFPEDKKEEEVLKMFSSIPYLNGGLFECLDKFDLNENGKYRPITYYDGFSTHDKLSENKKNFKYRAFIPNELFFLDKPTKVTVETGEVQVIGLIELFKQYNFTVEENTTTDAEVSLDPELLGRVFENLLADYNPDTQQSARKSTGSYYTPREIVDYMVDESLKAYLTGECQNNKEEVDSLFADGKVSSSAVAEKINHDLRSVKVLDPACGSGAFPMGILLRITELIGHLEGEKFNRYETKLQLLKDCIYGIDIQAIAMLICKLRFFISLICDCEKDETKPNLGIIPLPNLETKFVAANSLMPAKVKEFDNDLLHDDDLQEMKERLLGLRKSILEVRHTRRKMEIRREDRKLCEQIQKYIIEQASKPDEEKIARLRDVIEECEAELPKYKEDYWVDEMVTQTSLFDTGEPTIFRRNINKEKRDELNARIRSAQADIRREENKTTQDGFFEAVKQVTNWDPYDQNADSPFFDAEWMFGIGISRPSKQGFDIVIGNPPYVLIDKSIFTKYYSRDYLYQEGKIDLYRLFIEKSIGLTRDKGAISFITPNTFLSIKNCTKLRKFLLSDNSFVFIDSYDESIFEASVNNVVYLLIKGVHLDNINVNIHNSNSIRSYKLSVNNVLADPTYQIMINADQDAFSIREHMTKHAILLDKIDGIEMCLGAQPYHNTIHTKEQMDQKFLHADYKVNDNYVQDFGGKHFTRYIVDGHPKRWIDYSAEFYTKPDMRFFEGPRIVIREIPSKTLVCAYVENFALFNKSVFNIRLSKKSIDIKYLIAVLNSLAIGYYISAFGDKSNQNLFPRISMKILKNLPIPQATNAQQQPIIDLVNTILAKKKHTPQADTSVEENAIDQLVYQLYGLSREEIRIIEKG